MNRKAFMTSLWFFELSKVCIVATKKLFKSTKITRFQYIVILTKPWKGLELISSLYKNCFAICCTSDTIFLGLANETNWKHLKYCWERLHYLLCLVCVSSSLLKQMKISIKDFSSKCEHLQKSADLFTITKEILTEKFFWVVGSCRLCLHFNTLLNKVTHFRSSRPEVFLGKGVLKICSKVTGEHLCRSVILIKLLWNFIEIALRHGCSPVNLLHIFRNPFPKNTSGWLLLTFENYPELRSSFKI